MKVKSTVLKGDLKLEESEEISVISAGTSTAIKVPFNLVAIAPDGVSTVRFEVVDCFNRTVFSERIGVVCNKVDFPELSIVGAKLNIRSGGMSRYELVVNIRNRGVGAAKKIRVALDGMLDGISVEERSVVELGTIESLSNKICKFIINIPDDQSIRNFIANLTVTESYEIATINKKVNIPIVRE